jgi:hypothetical protein
VCWGVGGSLIDHADLVVVLCGVWEVLGWCGSKGRVCDGLCDVSVAVCVLRIDC